MARIVGACRPRHDRATALVFITSRPLAAVERERECQSRPDRQSSIARIQRSTRRREQLWTGLRLLLVKPASSSTRSGMVRPNPTRMGIGKVEGVLASAPEAVTADLGAIVAERMEASRESAPAHLKIR
jgi:hypothetical protein